MRIRTRAQSHQETFSELPLRGKSQAEKHPWVGCTEHGPEPRGHSPRSCAALRSHAERHGRGGYHHVCSANPGASSIIRSPVCVRGKSSVCSSPFTRVPGTDCAGISNVGTTPCCLRRPRATPAIPTAFHPRKRPLAQSEQNLTSRSPLQKLLNPSVPPGRLLLCSRYSDAALLS